MGSWGLQGLSRGLARASYVPLRVEASSSTLRMRGAPKP